MKRLTFDSLIKVIRDTIARFPDHRTGKNKTYSVEDAALGAFAVFFTQSPSFLAYQKTMQKNKGKSNAQSLFGMFNTPSDNQIKNLLDGTSPDHLFPVFSYAFKGLNDSGHLDTYRGYNGNLLLGLDGTQYYSSKSIHCEGCSQKKHKNGTITHYHTVITPVIAAPGKNNVISLQPEFITPQDGHEKQDCENAAAKRWFAKHSSEYSPFKFTILGDDLYCKQPLCELMLDNGFDFILVCKPDSHTTLYQWVDDFEPDDIGTVTVKRWTGKVRETDTYQFANGVPLRDSEDALFVNWCKITTTLPDGKIKYSNTFVTNFEISEKNVAAIVANGRARWKVENENNNVLKNRGYHLTHNFGHGTNHLSELLLTFNLLAFLFHTILEKNDKMYKLVRDELPSRQTFFNDIRALTRYSYFDNWAALLEFMVKGLEIDVPDSG